MESIERDLVGTWNLLSYDMVVSSEQGDSIVQLAGDSPLGRIVFTPNRFLSVHVTSPHVIAPTKARAWYQATDEEILRVARPNVSYCGNFELQEGVDGADCTLSTRVAIALDPNWIGTDQIRRAQLTREGGRQLLNLRPTQQFDLPVSRTSLLTPPRRIKQVADIIIGWFQSYGHLEVGKACLNIQARPRDLA